MASNEFINHKNYQNTENEPELVEDDSNIDSFADKVVPESAMSKEYTEIDRSEMVDREKVKVNFPQLKNLHPTMSKTVQ